MSKIHCWTRVGTYTLQSILRDGRFKTRFDGIASLAALDNLEERAQTEQRFYGYSPDLPVEKRPIFGYLCGQSDGQATHGHLILDEYGSAAIRFKDQIKERTTFCVGDSLRNNITPIAYDEGKLPVDIDTIVPYVEAQFHGGVTVEDIAEVVFLVERPTNSIKGLMQELASCGIDSRIQIVE